LFERGSGGSPASFTLRIWKQYMQQLGQDGDTRWSLLHCQTPRGLIEFRCLRHACLKCSARRDPAGRERPAPAPGVLRRG
jgi:hypothetical protein